MRDPGHSATKKMPCLTGFSELTTLQDSSHHVFTLTKVMTPCFVKDIQKRKKDNLLKL